MGRSLETSGSRSACGEVARNHPTGGGLHHHTHPKANCPGTAECLLMECREVVVQQSAEHNSSSSEPFNVWHLCSAQWCVARIATRVLACLQRTRFVVPYLAPGQSHLVAQPSTKLPSHHHKCHIAFAAIPPQVTLVTPSRVEIGARSTTPQEVSL